MCYSGRRFLACQLDSDEYTEMLQQLVGGEYKIGFYVPYLPRDVLIFHVRRKLINIVGECKIGFYVLYLPRDVLIPHVRRQLINIVGDFRLHAPVP